MDIVSDATEVTETGVEIKEPLRLRVMKGWCAQEWSS
jgi:hypothetical protein